jgi:hypothetical protein
LPPKRFTSTALSHHRLARFVQTGRLQPLAAPVDSAEEIGSVIRPERTDFDPASIAQQVNCRIFRDVHHHRPSPELTANGKNPVIQIGLN